MRYVLSDDLEPHPRATASTAFALDRHLSLLILHRAPRNFAYTQPIGELDSLATRGFESRRLTVGGVRSAPSPLKKENNV